MVNIDQKMGRSNGWEALARVVTGKQASGQSGLPVRYAREVKPDCGVCTEEQMNNSY